MLNQPTIEKLQALRLLVMAEAWNAQGKNPKISTLSFDERFGMLVDAEYMARDNRRLDRLLKDAQLRYPTACIEDVEPASSRGLDKAQLRQFAIGTWIHEHLNIVLSGKTGPVTFCPCFSVSHGSLRVAPTIPSGPYSAKTRPPMAR